MKIKFLIVPFSFLSAAMPIATISCSNPSKPTPTEDIKVESVTLSLDKSTVEVGDEVKLAVKVLPDNATNKNVDITINNLSDFYTNTSGIIVPYKSGTYNITAKAKDGSGKTDTKKLIVNPEETTTESWIDYANDRTFGLKVNSPSVVESCLGTGWILSDATPEDPNDYQYYVATNWHVVNGIQSSNLNFSIACSDEGESIPIDNYINVESSLIDEDNFLHGKDTVELRTQQGTITALQCCDLYILKMDLKNVQTSSKPCATQIKNKLNKLNNLTAQGKKITKIAPISDINHHFESAAKFYTLGYPAEGHPAATREQHSLNDESIKLNYSAEVSNNIHILTNKSIKYYQYLADCTPQYTASDETPVSSTWMTGGASGSMLLGDFGTDSTNHNYKVCGIYWGIFLDSTETYYWPSYSIFNSSYKNFVSNFY